LFLLNEKGSHHHWSTLFFEKTDKPRFRAEFRLNLRVPGGPWWLWFAECDDSILLSRAAEVKSLLCSKLALTLSIDGRIASIDMRIRS
jgi:hypothetical protein